MRLVPGELTLEQLECFRYPTGTLELDGKSKVDAAEDVVRRHAAECTPVYGVNTGFGKLQQTRIGPADLERLQRNLILSHCAGVGLPLEPQAVRLTMATKLASLARGASGVRWTTIDLLRRMLELDLLPVVPAQGSVGASGDLAPLAHLAAALLGEGDVHWRGQRQPAAQALADAGLEPISLAPKEGLGLINGTQCSTALALVGLFDAARLTRAAVVTGALSIDAAMASSAPFRPEIHALRGHAGQIEIAALLRDLVAGSAIRESHRDNDERVQDPYSLRCQPQVVGACLDLLRHAAQTLLVEANSVTDNPLVVAATGEILSGGNFHAEPVAFAADQIALAVAELGSIVQRRIALLVDPALNFGLPAFLSPDPGVNSGFMIAEVTAAALMAENKQRAAPCSIDSTPTSANQEDHVSMATHAARRLGDMTANLRRLVGIELLLAAQGVELRRPLETSERLQAAIDLLRARVPALEDDRILTADLECAAEIVASSEFADVAGVSTALGLIPEGGS